MELFWVSHWKHSTKPFLTHQKCIFKIKPKRTRLGKFEDKMERERGFCQTQPGFCSTIFGYSLHSAPPAFLTITNKNVQNWAGKPSKLGHSVSTSSPLVGRVSRSLRTQWQFYIPPFVPLNSEVAYLLNSFFSLIKSFWQIMIIGNF